MFKSHSQPHNGNYLGALFLQFKEFQLCWRYLFATRREVLEQSFLLFYGVNFEAGNETREKIWSDFAAEQNEEWSEKKAFLFISLFYREPEIEFEKNSLSERNSIALLL